MACSIEGHEFVGDAPLLSCVVMITTTIANLGFVARSVFPSVGWHRECVLEREVAEKIFCGWMGKMVYYISFTIGVGRSERYRERKKEVT